MTFGENVKKLRTERNQTLQQLSEQSNVSKTMLSEIERGKKTPTIDVACRIANALGTDLSVLIAPQATSRSYVLIRKEKRVCLHYAQANANIYILTPPSPTNPVELSLAILPPQASLGPLAPEPNGSKKTLSVHQGALEVRLGNEDPILLTAGDALTYHSDVERTVRNTSLRESCQFYIASSFAAPAHPFS